ncbi:MAG: hypothetical protein QHC89_02540 [Bosea sp. (in: a-proteobacteria)]|nr:hypothetical protein [Bosea sp. (in: a-proteobacteria)]
MPSEPVAAAATGLPISADIERHRSGSKSASAPADAGRDFHALLSEHREAEAALDAACAHYKTLFESSPLPEAVVKTGRRRIFDHETGAITWTQWEFRTCAQIERHFGMFPSWMHRRGAEGIKSERDALIAKLEELEKVRREVERNCGLLAAYDVVSAAESQAMSLYRELTAYRPATAIEVSAKAAFFLDVIQDTELEADEMATILRSFVAEPAPTERRVSPKGCQS